MFKALATFLILAGAFPLAVWGAMTSTHYNIYADTIDSGGVFSVSSSSGVYSLQSSIGEAMVGTASGTSYEIRGGFQAMDRGYLTVGLTSGSIHLGDISTSSVSSASSTISVSTDSDTGYNLSIASATWTTGTALASISGPAFFAGTEAYGMTTSTVGGADGTPFAINSGSNIFTTTAAVDNSATVLTIHVAAGSGTVAGDRSQAIVLQAAVNY